MNIDEIAYKQPSNIHIGIIYTCLQGEGFGVIYSKISYKSAYYFREDIPLWFYFKKDTNLKILSDRFVAFKVLDYKAGTAEFICLLEPFDQLFNFKENQYPIIRVTDGNTPTIKLCIGTNLSREFNQWDGWEFDILHSIYELQASTFMPYSTHEISKHLIQ